MIHEAPQPFVRWRTAATAVRGEKLQNGDLLGLALHLKYWAGRDWTGRQQGGQDEEDPHGLRL